MEKSEAKKSSDYPKLQVEKITFEFTDEDFDEIEQFIYGRFKEIEFYESNPNMELPMCTEKERFRDADKYAVMKVGNKRAIKLYDNKEDAEKHAAKEPNLFVETRAGTDKKCLEYCNVCEFCDYWKNNYAERKGE